MNATGRKMLDILKELKRIEKTDMLILEDFCMHPFDPVSRMSLMDIIEDRYGKKTIVFVFNLIVLVDCL